MRETHHIGATISLLFVCVTLLVSAALAQAHKTRASDVQFVGIAPGIGAVELYPLNQAAAATVATSIPRAVDVVATTTELIGGEQGNVAVEGATNVLRPTPEEVALPLPPVPTVSVSAAQLVKSSEEPDISPVTKEEVSFSEQLVRAIHERTNAIRAKEKLPTFAYDTVLAINAAGYSSVMQEEGFLGHTDLNGCNMTCRFEIDGYSATAWGENLARWQSSYSSSVDEVAEYFVEKWVQSEGHRDNLLSPTFTQEGIGVSRRGNEIYVTVHFAKP